MIERLRIKRENNAALVTINTDLIAKNRDLKAKNGELRILNTILSNKLESLIFELRHPRPHHRPTTMRYKVTISTQAADFNFERSASLIIIGRCENEFPYSVSDGKLTIYQATTECLDAILSLGTQMQTQIDVTWV